jgi:hypothetical protein
MNLFNENIFMKYSYFVSLLFVLLLLHSCKTDEFKFDEIKIKEDWGINLTMPLFNGKDKNGNVLEFRDFIHDWKEPVPNLPGTTTVLDYENSPDKTIPSSLIFDSSTIIDSFHFDVQGIYKLSELTFQFTVINSCPFPLNLQLQFFNKNNTNNLGPPVLPPAFAGANFGETPVKPLTTKYSLKLDSLQIQSINNSNRVKFKSWFDKTDFINQNDTIYAHYPIEVLIVVIGKFQPRQ